MLRKDFSGCVVPDVTPRFGTIGEGIHHVVILDAIRMPQNQKSSLSDDGKIVKGEMKLLDKARPCFDQEVTTMVFQIKGGTNVIFDHRSDFGWAKKNELFTSRKTGEQIMLDQDFINKNGLVEFQGKWYKPNADINKEIGIEDAAKEKDCFNMLSRVYAAAGLVGDVFDPKKLVGRELKINVVVDEFARPGDKFNRFKVAGWYKVDEEVATTAPKAKAAVLATAEVDDDLPF